MFAQPRSGSAAPDEVKNLQQALESSPPDKVKDKGLMQAPQTDTHAENAVPAKKSSCVLS